MSKTYSGQISFLGYDNCLKGNDNTNITSKKFVDNEKIFSIVNNLNYTIYPNPTNSDTKIQLQIVENNQTVSCNLYDLKGSLVKSILNSTVYNAGSYLIDIKRDELPKGEYILEIKENDIYHSDKIIFN